MTIPQVQAHGAAIPCLGFGTWELSDSVAERMVVEVLAMGYRHIDTAQIYRNENGVGRAIRASGVPRDEVFLTTKVWIDAFHDGELQASVEQSLRKLQSDYVDLLLLHWPNPAVALEQTISALNQVREQGLAKHIGISNFPTGLMSQALALSPAPLVTNQVEYQPFLDQSRLLAACRQQAMALTAYSPLAVGKVFSHPTLQRIAAKYDKDPGQVTLRWLLQQQSVVAIPRSSKPAHARSNFNIFDFRLQQEDMAAIFELAHPGGRQCSPAGLAPDWDQ